MRYDFYSPDELKPSGWMKKQLEIQANGLSGALDKVWRDVRDSKWIGGDAEGWERVPYWLDGFIPLAYLLDNDDMKARAKKYIDAILQRQCEDGWICPCTEEERATYDLWGVILISKVLIVYYDCSHDKRALLAVRRALENFYTILRDGKAQLKTWGKYRWFETMIAIERVADEFSCEWTGELCRLLKEQGVDYMALREGWKRPINRWVLDTHIVNIMMALKAEAVSYELMGGEYTDEAEALWEVLEKYNATSAGIFTGDECLSGISPIQGSELCSVVELMFSAEMLFSHTGQAKWADRLERAAFNALPATITEDMWAHQYDQMSNQIDCTPFPGKSLFRTNGPGSHIFGLEPHFGCCTANFNQGWPKLCQSVFMKGDSEIVNVTPIPALLDTKINGTAVRVAIDTLYPFRNTVKYTVETEAPVSFALKIHIPAEAKNVTADGTAAEVSDGFITLSREWAGKSEITLSFEFEPRFVTLGGGVYFVKYGPLTFSMPIEGKWKMVEYERNGVERKFPYCDWHIARAGEFAYAFSSDKLTVREITPEGAPFSHTAPALVIDAELVRINWEMADGYLNVPAKYPTDCTPIGETEKITLFPYGCTTLRMTEMPFAK